MNTRPVIALTKACKLLAVQRDALADALRSDPLPVWLPDTKPDVARELAIEAVSELYLGERGRPRPVSGIICISEKTATLAKAVNEAKAALADCVHALKPKPDERKTRKVTLHKLLTEEKGELYVRDRRVQDALRDARFADIDLTAAYRQLRILNNVDAISFSWQTKRREVISLEPREAIALAEKRLSGDELQMALRILAQYRHPVARVRNKSQAQLKANVYFFERGERKRVLIPTAAPVLVVGAEIPVCRWPGPLEAQVPGLPRQHSQRIADQPLIPALSLYPYAKDLH